MAAEAFEVLSAIGEEVAVAVETVAGAGCEVAGPGIPAGALEFGMVWAERALRSLPPLAIILNLIW